MQELELLLLFFHFFISFVPLRFFIIAWLVFLKFFCIRIQPGDAFQGAYELVGSVIEGKLKELPTEQFFCAWASGLWKKKGEFTLWLSSMYFVTFNEYVSNTTYIFPHKRRIIISTKERKKVMTYYYTRIWLLDNIYWAVRKNPSRTSHCLSYFSNLSCAPCNFLETHVTLELSSDGNFFRLPNKCNSFSYLLTFWFCLLISWFSIPKSSRLRSAWSSFRCLKAAW